MREGWEEHVLADFYEITSSKRVFRSEWTESGVPFFRAREIVRLARDGRVDNELFISPKMYEEYVAGHGAPKPGDLMVTGVGTLGACYVVREQDRFYFKDGNILWFKKTGEIDSRFVEYAFKSDALRSQIGDVAGATVGTFTIQKAKLTRVPVPPLAEQHRIVAILDEAFAVIQIASTALGEAIQETKSLVEIEREQAFDQGNGWPVVPLSSALSVQPRNGWSPPAVFQTGEGVPVLTLSAVTGFEFDGTRTKPTSAPTKPDAHYWLHDGELLVTRANTPRLVGHAAVCESLAVDTICPDLIMKMTVDRSVAITEYVHQYMKSRRAREYMTTRAVGANPTMVKVSKGIVQDLPLPLPDRDVQRRVVERLACVERDAAELTALYSRKLALLDELKRSLLHEAFSGNL